MKPALAILAATTGPVVVDVLGYDLPVLSAATAVIGVVLAYMLAPPSSREPHLGQSVALVTLFALLLLAAVVYFQHTPLVAVGWSIGLGYSGRVVLEELGSIARERVRGVIGVIFNRAPADPEPPSPLPSQDPK